MRALHSMVCKLRVSDMNLTGLRKRDRLLQCDSFKDNGTLYKDKVKRMVKKVIDEKDHPLNGDFNVMPSGYRYRMPVYEQRDINPHLYLLPLLC